LLENNLNHQEYVDAAKTAAITMGKSALISALLKKVPFLFIGPLNPIMGWIIQKFLEVLIRETEFGIFFLYIDLRVDRQGQDFTKVAMENHKVQQTGTEDEKRASELRLINSFKNFISLSS